MVSEKPTRPRRSVLARARMYCFLLTLPGLVFAGLYFYQQQLSLPTALLISAGMLLWLLLISMALMESLTRPLQTLSNVVAALREGDTSFRARGAGADDAMGELASEINTLADLLQKHRVRSLEATALLARILEVMHAPLFAFDRTAHLKLINNAGLQLLNQPQARCMGQSASELHLAELLSAPDQSIHAFADKPTRWLLRKAVFRQDGTPHTLLLLSDVSVPLQEEEQVAWKRLIRVLGHELSNSLAPIKSIAGTLLSQVEELPFDEGTKKNFRRGLGVVESRADALHRFVQSYRQLAQLPPPQRRCFDIAPLLERVVALELRLPVTVNPGPPMQIMADPDQLEQLFINLLANAVDASLSNDSQSVHLSWQRTEQTLLVHIEDCGRGIANVDNLFVPFYTTKAQGSGVGLALAQQIARAHGGEIILKNREDAEGACATVRLPRTPSAAPEADRLSS